MITERLVKIFVEVFEVKEVAITDETKQSDIENWDSIGHLRLIMAVEEEFGVKFLTKEMQEINSVRMLIKLIESKLNWLCLWKKRDFRYLRF